MGETATGLTDFSDYGAVLVDEVHFLSLSGFRKLMEMASHCPIIFSGDLESMIAPEELQESAIQELLEIPDLQTFRLTNRIRTNPELSSFVQNMLHLSHGGNRRNYSHVSVFYSNNREEARNLLQDAIRQGYVNINENQQESEKLVAVLDRDYYYDERGYLRSASHQICFLARQLNLAKESIMIIVREQEALYTSLLRIL